MIESSVLPTTTLGIDISKHYFDVTLIKPSHTGQDPAPASGQFDNTPDGFKQLQRLAQDAAGQAGVCRHGSHGSLR